MMQIVRRALARLRVALGGHQQANEDLQAEMEVHIEMATDEYLRRGMQPEDARRRARVEAGGLTQAAERAREQRGLPWMEILGADIRYAIRHFVRTPLSTVTMVLVLSLGLGTSVLLFAVMNSVARLPPPGIAQDAALVRIRGTVRTDGGFAAESRRLSWPEVQAYAARADLFTTVAAEASEPIALSVSDPSSAVSATALFVSANYYGMLGIRPALGTVPMADPNVLQSTTSPTAMISHAMWMRRFGGASDVIGQTIRLNDVPVRIVGVAPERFIGTSGAGAMTLWVPLNAYPQIQKRTSASLASPDSMFLTAVARLRAGVLPSMASPEVATLAARVALTPRGETDLNIGGPRIVGAEIVPLLASNDRIGDRRDAMISEGTAIGFAMLILLITCTNVSALMVGLATARRREIGVRLSLGAPRARLIRQLLTESIVLAVAAAAVGLLATAAGIRLLGSLLVDVQLVIDWRVTLATCAVAILTGILFGLTPALHATRISIGEVLKSSATAVAEKRSRLQRILVIAQVTLTQPLLVALGVGILTMSSDAGMNASSRFADRIAEVEVDAWAARMSNSERESRIAAAVQRIAAMPGVTAVMPMQLGTITMPLTVLASDRVAGTTPAAPMQMTLAAAPKGYFSALGIPLVRGRDFTPTELTQASTDGSRVATFDAVIIGSDLARRLWDDASPLGRRLTMKRADGSPLITMAVVGVVDAAAAGASEVGGQVRVYVPYSPMNTGVVVRTSGIAEPMLGAIRTVVSAEAGQMPVVRAETMAQRMANARGQVWRATGAVAVGGALALFLSALGLYAVVALAVGQRTREIGIRTALGASSARIVRMFFASGLTLGAVGVAFGLPLSLVMTRWVSRFFNWPLETSTALGVAIGVAVLVVASLAAWIPARRASAVDPILALRSE